MIDRAHPPEDSEAPNGSTPRVAGRRVNPAPMVLGLVLGLAVVLAIGLAVAFLRRDHTPRLTEADYLAAVERWETQGPASYNVDLELTGSRPGQIHAEVRDGDVVHMTRDGVEPKQERTWYYWTVPGMFDTIGQELEMAADPANSFQAAGAQGMVMWAEFDPQLGYPLRYDRVVMGTNFEIHWRVTRFDNLDQRPAAGN